MSTEFVPRRASVPPPPQRPPRPAAPPKPAVPPRPAAPPQPAAPPEPAGPPPPAAPAVIVVRRSARLAAPLVCLVLGTGLLGGAAAGTWLTDDGGTAAEQAFDDGRSLWRDLPVDELFPPELTGENAGPGGADRRWLRLAVAPASGCAEAFDPLLADVLAQVGCHRLVRATYMDETESRITTVGLLFTEADRAGMEALRDRFEREGLGERPDLMPRGYAPENTLAEDFGDAQRASWSFRILTSAPVVAYAVSGFADGRPIPEPQPASQAVSQEEDTTVALSGLGHDARALARLVADTVRRTTAEYAEEVR